MINLNLVKPQSSITNALVTKPCSNYKINTLKKDCVSFTSKPLDVNKCIENLSNIKTDGLFSDKKFEQNDLKILKELLTKDSSKWELVQKLAETRGIGSKTVTAIACCYDKERSDKLIKLFDNLEKLKNNPKNSYSQKEIDALKSSSLNKLNNFDKVIELAKTFKKKDIIQFAKNKSDDEIKNCYDILTNDKYVKKYDTTYKNHIKYDLKTLKSFQSFLKTNLSTKSINQIHALAGKDFSLLGNIINQAEGKKPHYQFEENKCHENEYIIKITTDNNNRCELEGDICLSQKEGFISARISNSKNSTTTSNNKDLRHNITTERIRDNYSDRLLSEKTYKKENGKITNTTIIEKSDITGVYNVYDIDEQGNKTQTCSAKIDKNTGKRTVHKKLKSLDGTITKFDYTQSKNGDKEISYEIVDKDGKVLCKEYLTYEKINKNVIKTTRNGNIYKSWIDNNRLFIYDKKSDYTYSKNLSNLIEVSNPHTKKEIIYNLTNMSGEDLLNLLFFVNKITSYSNNSGSYNLNTGYLNLSKPDLYIISHEIGHAIDYSSNLEGQLTSNRKIRKIYKTELDLFKKHFSAPQKESVNYFINQKSHYSGEWGGLSEIVAEANAILHSISSSYLPKLGERSLFLQQYFPRTIAAILNSSKDVKVPRL